MSNPRLDRLGNEHIKVEQLAARSPFIHVLGKQGSPPTDYTIQFTCRGVERIDGGKPVYREDHRVRITLGPNYPVEKPGLQWLTPIYHPNIASSGAVCIGRGWSSGGRYLDDLVIYLAQMVRFEGEGLTYTADAYNPAAYAWAVGNRHLLPVDKRPMFAANLSDKIKVTPAHSGNSAPITINILGGSSNLDIRILGSS